MHSHDAIFVGVRVRPFSEQELNPKACPCGKAFVPLADGISAESCRWCGLKRNASRSPGLTIHDCSVSILCPDNTEKTFLFDAALDMSSIQADVDKVYGERLINVLRQNYNVTCFAYGQTGTGKTTTMMGRMEPWSERGLAIRVIEQLFAQSRQGAPALHCRATMLEVYNEKLRDLLLPRGVKFDQIETRSNLDVHVHPKLGTYVPNLTESAVSSLEEVMELVRYGNTIKTLASTSMNRQSSRAHTILTLSIEMVLGSAESSTVCDLKDKLSNGGVATSGFEMPSSPSGQRFRHRREISRPDLVRSFLFAPGFIRLTFADLAGRENEKTTLASGERLIELSFINRSLFHLTGCIQALSTEQRNARSKANNGTQKVSTATFAAFRNSKLTLLLSDALTGNSKTFMVGTLSPARTTFDDNMSTLRFAATVGEIEVKTERNLANNVDVAKSLESEVQGLRARLMDEGAVKNKMLRQHISALEKLCSTMGQSWDEAAALTRKQTSLRRQGLSDIGLDLDVGSVGFGDTSGNEKDAEESFEKCRGRRKVSKSVGLRGIVLEDGDWTTKESWFLGNISDDPALCGTIILAVPQGRVVSVGSDAAGPVRSGPSHFTLCGLGIPSKLCEIEHRDPVGPGNEGSRGRLVLFVEAGTSQPGRNRVSTFDAMVEPSITWEAIDCVEGEEQPVVEINGRRFGRGDRAALNHGDLIVLGINAHAFRVVWSTAEAAAQCVERAMAGDSDEEPEVSSLKESPQKQNYDEILENGLKRRLGEKAYQAFMSEVRQAQRLVDEANAITNRLRKGWGFYFRLDAHGLHDLTQQEGVNSAMPPPNIIVLVLRAPGTQRNSRRRGTILDRSPFEVGDGNNANSGEEVANFRDAADSVWSLPKFEVRLSMMRDRLEEDLNGDEFVDQKSLRERLDPWADDYAFAEAMLLRQQKLVESFRGSAGRSYLKHDSVISEATISTPTPSSPGDICSPRGMSPAQNASCDSLPTTPIWNDAARSDFSAPVVVVPPGMSLRTVSSVDSFPRPGVLEALPQKVLLPQMMLHIDEMLRSIELEVSKYRQSVDRVRCSSVEEKLEVLHSSIAVCCFIAKQGRAYSQIFYAMLVTHTESNSIPSCHCSAMKRVSFNPSLPEKKLPEPTPWSPKPVGVT